MARERRLTLMVCTEEEEEETQTQTHVPCVFKLVLHPYHIGVWGAHAL
jgi:hypothetical protein